MRIVVIGNSHLAAFKLAWDDLADNYQDVRLVFFGSAGEEMRSKVAIEDDCLVAVTEEARNDFYFTSGGLTKIDFSDFDAVLLIGMGCRMLPLYSALKSHRVYDAPSSSLPSRKKASYRTISAACIAQICMDQMKNTSLFQILSLIRSVSNIPAFIIPCPFPSEACAYDDRARWAFLKRIASKTVQQSYYEGLACLCRSFAATLITQPDTTITGLLFTKEELSVGSVRFDDHLLTTLHNETDYVHMNRDYGKEVLTFILQGIGQR